MTTKSPVFMVMSAHDFVETMAAVENCPTSIPPELILMRTLSMAVYRDLIRKNRGKYDGTPIQNTPNLLKLYFNFNTAACWGDIKRAFSAITICGGTEDLEFKMQLFDDFELLIQDVVVKAAGSLLKESNTGGGNAQPKAAEDEGGEKPHMGLSQIRKTPFEPKAAEDEEQEVKAGISE